MCHTEGTCVFALEEKMLLSSPFCFKEWDIFGVVRAVLGHFPPRKHLFQFQRLWEIEIFTKDSGRCENWMCTCLFFSVDMAILAWRKISTPNVPRTVPSTLGTFLNLNKQGIVIPIIQMRKLSPRTVQFTMLFPRDHCSLEHRTRNQVQCKFYFFSP